MSKRKQTKKFTRKFKRDQVKLSRKKPKKTRSIVIPVIIGAALLAILTVFLTHQTKIWEQKRLEKERQSWQQITRMAQKSRLKTEEDFAKALTAVKNYPAGDPDENLKLINVFRNTAKSPGEEKLKKARQKLRKTAYFKIKGV